MNKTYKDYNNYSQQDKDSMRTRADDLSNENEATLITQTDEVEGLLRSLVKEVQDVDANTDAIESKLDLIAGHVDELENKLDSVIGGLTDIKSAVQGTTYEVTSQGQAIVQAIQGQ